MSSFGLDPATWRTLNRLLDQALDLPDEARTRWLEDLPSEHEHLRPRLASLLAHASSNATVDSLPKLLGDAETSELPVTPVRDRTGERVGPYCIRSRLGEGGMASVWLADRDDGILRRVVALKLPRGMWAHPELAARWSGEREILASLSHPHIAKLYDAGLTDDGQPFLALEYVDGLSIDAYAREHRLDVRARLRLFLQVIRAAAHAHAQLVVHRDIKPSNILVTTEGHAQLLDFGIAKLLEDGRARETEITRVSGRALTLAYASPEQITGAPLGVGSDVYSLGVVLYELLAGASPHEPGTEGYGALEHAVLHSDPRRPSEIAIDPQDRRALRGDLDTILRKALRKSPDDRYATADAFADDLQRFLQGQPVLAQPDSAAYRARKFVDRNRVVVGAASVVLAAILGGAGVAVWHAREALAQQRRAEEVKGFIASIFENADPYAAEAEQELTASALLAQAKTRLDRSALEPELRVELLNLIGTSLLALGKVDEAEQIADEANAEASQVLAEDDPFSISSRLLRAEVHLHRGRASEMREEIDAVLPFARSQIDEQPRQLVRALQDAAHAAIDEARYAEAHAAAQEAYDVSASRLGEKHLQTVAAASLLAEAYLYGERDRDDALALAERALSLTEGVHPDQPSHPQIATMRGVHGRALAEAGHIRRGVAALEQGVEDGIAFFGPSSRTVGFRLGNIASWQRRIGDIPRSLESVEESIRILGALVQPDSYVHGALLTTRGVTLLAARRGPEAVADLTESEETLTRVLGPDSWMTLTARFNRAVALAYVARFEDANAALSPVRDPTVELDNPSWALHVEGIVERLRGDARNALRTQDEALERLGEGSMAAWDRVRIVREIGLAQLELEHFDDARNALEEAFELYLTLETLPHPARIDTLVGLGRAHLALDDASGALPLLQEADAFWRDFDPENRWAGEAAFWLARCYAALGRDAESRKARARATRILSESPFPSDARLIAGVR